MASTRKQVRKRLKTLFSECPEFDAVYDYAPLDLRDQDKVVAIYSDRSSYEMLTAHLNNRFYRFVLECYAKRRENEAGAEDDLDDMHEAIRATIRANVTGDGVWNELNLEDDSDAYFGLIATEPYRIEQHRLLVKVTDSGE